MGRNKSRTHQMLNQPSNNDISQAYTSAMDFAIPEAVDDDSPRAYNEGRNTHFAMMHNIKSI